MAESFRSPSSVVRRLKLTPLVSRKIKNWPSFMYHYAFGLAPEAPYTFRDGARLSIGRGIDHVPVIEIFVRQDYGAVPNDSVIVDLGANIGTFAIYAAMSARNTHLYAYEPMPELFELMQSNIRLNGLAAVVSCFNLAVAAEDATRELFVAGRDLHFPTLVLPQRRESTASRTVRCTTLATILDANALAQIDLLKMDIEGAEYETFYGTPSRYFDRIREIRMEYHDLDGDTRNVRSLKQFLVTERYRITRERANTATNGNLWAVKHD